MKESIKDLSPLFNWKLFSRVFVNFLETIYITFIQTIYEYLNGKTDVWNNQFLPYDEKNSITIKYN